MIKLNDVIKFCKNIGHNDFFSMVLETDAAMVKGKSNPYIGRVKWVTILNNIRLGRDYMKSPLSAKKGKSWFSYPYILTDGSNYFLRVAFKQLFQESKFLTLDGKAATQQEIAAISKYLVNKPTNGDKSTDMRLYDIKLKSIKRMFENRHYLS